MKIAYQDKDCHKFQSGYWKDCKGCIFLMNTLRTWPCDLIPRLKCTGLDIYVQTDELEEVFKV
jgi:hypothetical protein